MNRTPESSDLMGVSFNSPQEVNSQPSYPDYTTLFAGCVSNSPQGKIVYLDMRNSQRTRQDTNEGRLPYRYRNIICYEDYSSLFKAKRIVPISLAGAFGVAMVVVGYVFANTVGMYVGVAGGVILVATVVAIVLLVKKYREDKFFLNSLTYTICDTVPPAEGEQSENDKWNQELHAIDQDNAPNRHPQNRVFSTQHGNRKYTVRFDAQEWTITVSLD